MPVRDIAWIHHVTRSYMPYPLAMMLGGSRGGKAGQQALASSDYDILMLTDYLTKPVSLTMTSPYSGNKFDIILRDPDSLAYEAENARNGGNGTLLHLCAFSQIVYDRIGLAALIQPKALQLYKQGPKPITQESFAQELADSRQDIKDLGRERDPNRFSLAAISLTHRFGRLALRANRHWVANGKVIARFLDTNLPDFKHDLADAAARATPGNVIGLRHILTHHLPALHVQGVDAVPLHREHNDYPVNASIADVYHHGRLSNAALLQYLYPDQQKNTRLIDIESELVPAAARDWVHYMFNLTASAVDAERYARGNGEYQFALGRYLNQITDTACLARYVNPSRQNLRDRISLLAQDAPAVLEAIPAAWQGNPAALHKAAKVVLADIIGKPEAFQPRPVPPHLRCRAENVGLI